MAIKIKKITSDKSPIVGIAIVAHPKIVATEPGKIYLEEEKPENAIEIGLTFMQGNLNTMRSEMHKMVDDYMDILEEGR